MKEKREKFWQKIETFVKMKYKIFLVVHNYIILVHNYIIFNLKNDAF